MAQHTTTEIDIWAGVIAPKTGDMPPVYADAVLQWRFNDEAKLRMNELADRNNKGGLTEAEREELEGYVNVGQVIGILQVKARLSLNRADSDRQN